MKNLFKVLGIIAIIAIVGLFVMSCGDGLGGGGGGTMASELQGTWKHETMGDDFTLVISSNALTYGGDYGELTGSAWEALVDSGYKWRASNGKIELGYSGVWETVYDYEISGNELTLESEGVEIGVFVK
jgi:hypothetical protein